MTSTPGRFVDAAVIVTGGAHGIGRACAVRLAAEGARVAVADLDRDAATEVVADLGAGADRHLAVGLDVTDVAAVDQGVAEVADRFGGIDVLVNVAGGDGGHGRFEETPDEVWVRLLDLNLLSVVRCCRATIGHLRRSTRGPAIVNTSSLNAIIAFGSEPYSSAKAGIGALTVNLAASLAPDGIRVNTVAPGTIRPGTGTARRAGPIGCARSTRSAASVSRRTSPLPWPFWRPAMPHGSPVTPCPSTADC